jgi:SAM-dependent methyltransferase
MSSGVGTGFGAVADEYECGRAGYAPAAVAKLVEELRLVPDLPVLDLAAGTGKMTRQLAATGAAVVAVEPDPRMLARLTASAPNVRAFEGHAEHIPLGESQVRAVVVGSAFHWFDAPAALREIHRVLAPGGRLALAWNPDDDPPSEWATEIRRLVRRYVSARPGHAARHWPEVLTEDALFGNVRQWLFPWQVEMTVDQVLARTVSYSYVAALDEDTRTRIQEGVRHVLAGYPSSGGRYTMRYRTMLIVADRQATNGAAWTSPAPG